MKDSVLSYATSMMTPRDWDALTDLPAPEIPLTLLREVEERVESNTRLKDQQLIVQAQNEAKKELVKRACLREYFQNFVEKGEFPMLIENEVKEIMDNQAKKLQTKSPYCLLTINPRPEVTFAALKKQVDKFLKKKTVPEWFQVYEVRKQEEGLHCHVLCRYTPPPYQFKRSAKNTFKGICDAENSAVLNFKFVEEALLNDKIAYMLGNKQEKKQKGVKDTLAYREKYNIPQFAESSPPLTCRATQIAMEGEAEPVD